MENSVMHSDREILGGSLVFVGTRVPVRILIEYLEEGDSIDDFLIDFPSVSRHQAVNFLELLHSNKAINFISSRSI